MRGTFQVPTRLWWIFLGLAGLFLVPLLLVRSELLAWTPEGARDWLNDYGRYAWLIALGLLISDLVLPMPATAVMAALGFIYGPLVGGLIGTLGTMLSGCLAYGICRGLGRGAAIKLVGEEDLRKGETLFRRFGAWLIVLSRWLPLFPEVVSCMAGLVRMPWTTFIAAMSCGTVPVALVFASVGYAGVEYPGWSIFLSAVMPPILWLSIRQWLSRE